jgi:hypothetical protein
MKPMAAASSIQLGSLIAMEIKSPRSHEQPEPGTDVGSDSGKPRLPGFSVRVYYSKKIVHFCEREYFFV